MFLWPNCCYDINTYCKEQELYGASQILWKNRYDGQIQEYLKK